VPTWSGVVVSPRAGLLLEEDAGALLGRQLADLQLDRLLPFRHALRILLISAIKRPLRPQPDPLWQPADLDLRELHPEFPPYQVTMIFRVHGLACLELMIGPVAAGIATGLS
jgi:hypothetical protein